MTTKDDIATIERLLERKQTVPSQLIRALVMTCKQLLAITAAQNQKIRELQAEKQPEPQP